MKERDANLFKKVINNNNHVLYKLLPPIKDDKYGLRDQVHNRKLPELKFPHDEKNFLLRMLYIHIK